MIIAGTVDNTSEIISSNGLGNSFLAGLEKIVTGWCVGVVETRGEPAKHVSA
jgi:hypothetical protein